MAKVKKATPVEPAAPAVPAVSVGTPPVEGAPDAAVTDPQDGGITAEIFPDFDKDGNRIEYDADGNPVEVEGAPAEPAAEPTPAPPAAGEGKPPEVPVTPAAPADADPAPSAEPGETPPAPELAMLVEEFGDRPVTLKVDGVEQTVKFSELLKLNQLDRHLTQKAQDLADKQRTLDVLLAAQAAAKLPAPTTPAPAEPPKDRGWLDDNPETKAFVDGLETKLTEVSRKLNDLEFATKPTVYESNLTSLDRQMKEQGLHDFRDFLPKVEEFVKSLPPEEMALYDTPAGYAAVYKDLKLAKEVATPTPTPTTPAAAPAAAPVAVPAVAPAVAPVTVPATTPAPGTRKIVPIAAASVEAGGGSVAVAPGTEDLVALRAEATKTGVWFKVYEAMGLLND